jgi:HK97 family phage prohead protease
MIVFLKEAGTYTQKDFTGTELADWFKDHTDDSGDVTEDIVTFTECEIKAADGEGFPWVLSDMTLDRDQERIDPSGWDLKEYRKNPIVLWGHNMWEPAIGVMKNVKRPREEKGQLTGTVVFDESGNDPLAMKVASKVRQGILSKGSVGFRTKKIEILDDDKDGAKLIHRKQELVEFSIVNYPSNPNAQVQAGAEADERKNYVEYLMQDLKNRETSGGETSQLLDLLSNKPAQRETKIEELFSGQD